MTHSFCHLDPIINLLCSTLDQCTIEKCYLKLKKDENEEEVSNSQLSQTSPNGTNIIDNENDAHNEMDESLDHLKLLSKNCHLAEMQCAQCSNAAECKTGSSQTNPDETEFGNDYGSGMNLK